MVGGDRSFMLPISDIILIAFCPYSELVNNDNFESSLINYEAINTGPIKGQRYCKVCKDLGWGCFGSVCR